MCSTRLSHTSAKRFCVVQLRKLIIFVTYLLVSVFIRQIVQIARRMVILCNMIAISFGYELIDLC